MVREGASTAVALTRGMEGEGGYCETTAPVIPRFASFLALHHKTRERPNQRCTSGVFVLEIQLQAMLKTDTNLYGWG